MEKSSSSSSGCNRSWVNLSSHFKFLTMPPKDFLLRLQQENILTDNVKDGKPVLHLKRPVKIHLTKNAVKQLQDNYDPNKEKGGVMVAIPEKIQEGTLLTIDRIIFLTNVADTPEWKYRPHHVELKKALQETLFNDITQTLPIRFHTHPTNTENPVSEWTSYIAQSDTSDADKRASEVPIKVEYIDILMPRSLVICSSLKTFIGFYNGAIAPTEFEPYRNEKIKETTENICNGFSDWLKKDEKHIWISAIIAAAIIFLFIRFPKVMFPLTGIIAVASVTSINSSGKAKYYAQVKGGSATVELP